MCLTLDWVFGSVNFAEYVSNGAVDSFCIHGAGGLLVHPAYTRVCLIYYYPLLVKEER